MTDGPSNRPAPAEPARAATSNDPDVPVSTARLESEMAALGSILLASGDRRSVENVADLALDILCRATGAEAGLVTSTDETYEAVASRGVNQETIDVIVGYGRLGGPLAEALQAPDAYVSADVATAPLREDVRTSVLANGVRHLVVVGLRVEGRLVGLLALGWRAERPLEPSPLIVLQAAAVVAAKIENARLLRAVEAGLTQERLLTRRMQALVELTRLPDGVAGDDAGLERLLAEVTAVIGAAGALFGQPAGDGIAVAATHGIGDPAVAWLASRTLRDPALARRLMEPPRVLLEPLDVDAAAASNRPPSPSLPYRSVAAFGIGDGDGLVGAVYAVFHDALDELEIDARTLEAIGRVLDISFANDRLRNAIAAGERRYRELFEGSPDALLVFDGDGRVVDANSAAARLYGSGVIGRTDAELVVPASVSPAGSDARNVTRYTATGRRLDGSTFPEEVDVRRLDVGGEARTLAIVRDVTERQRLQAELVQAQKMEAIGQLVAGVAHELNNPLASIVAFSQLIRTDPSLPDDLRTQADLLVGEADRTRAIVTNLLDFARQRPPERTSTALRPLVERVLDLQSYALSRSDVVVELDIPGDLPPIAVDRSQFQQVVLNLTVNASHAIQASGRPGRIRIAARAVGAHDDRRVRIEVEDDGPGVASDVLDRLFVPFVTTRPPGEGTGLGLSVSFGIVSAHGGTIAHEPVETGGARFVVELPTGVAVAARERASPAEHPLLAAPIEDSTDAGRPNEVGPNDSGPSFVGPNQTAPNDGGPNAARPSRRGLDDGLRARQRVLVLDDEPAIREFLRRVLIRGGYEPVVAATGRVALDIVRGEPRPDAILCDHRMAGMSGTEFHAAVAAIDPGLAGRFAFMSGDVLNPELRGFASAHGVRLLAKPFDIAAVDEIVRALLASPVV